MNEKAKQARAVYMKEYRQKNRERLNEYKRNWCKMNPEKVKRIAERYWIKKASGELVVL